jgi:hypothetical protein
MYLTPAWNRLLYDVDVGGPCVLLLKSVDDRKAVRVRVSCCSLMECWIRLLVMRSTSLGCVLEQFCFCLGLGGPTMCVGTFVMITNSIKSGGYPRMSLFRFGELHSLGNFACVFAWGYKLTIGSPICMDIVFALRLLFVFD